MFNLNHAIDAYAREVAGYCAASVNVAELKDHLHCLVEQYHDKGLDEESAFAAAVSQMGKQSELRAAYEADLSWPRRLLRWDQRLQQRLT
ncbi:MAG: permease prefix domain 1-containing protein, partial [Pseudomonadota bacterium]